MDASERSNIKSNSTVRSNGLRHQGELTFQNLRYIITVFSVSADVLSIEAEQKSDGARWRGSFSSHNIEDMTQRTGNYKKFTVFVKMLHSAILQDSDSVFVDLLTYQDLELLKSRKTRTLDGAKPSVHNNKRYLILTYVGEFDRIHYPLPLAQEDIVEPDILRRTIKRLRIEVESLRKQLHISRDQGVHQDTAGSTAGMDKDENDKLRTENTRLLTQLRCLEDSMMHHIGYKENSILEDDKKRLAKDLAMYQKKCSVLLAKLESKVYMMKSQRDVQALEDRIEQLQHSLKIEKDNRKKWVANLMKEKLALSEQVRHARESERTMRLRFREMEKEMEHFKRRLKLQGIHNVDSACGRIRVNSLVGSRRTTPLSSRENSPGHLRCLKTAGSRASSCPTFGSQNRPKLNIKEELRLPIYKDYLTRTPTSLPSSARFRDSPGHESSRSARQGDYHRNSSPKSFQPLHRNFMQDTREISKNRKEEATRGSSKSPSNCSMRSTRHNLGEKKFAANHKMKQTPTTSTISNSCCTSEGESQEHHDALSQTSSPRKVLQQVKAKLAEYARIQGISLCAQ